MLVTARHYKLCDGIADLAGKAFTPTHIRYNPLIFSGHAVHSTKEHLARPTHAPTKKKSESKEHKVNLLIRDLCQKGTDSVHDMRAINTESKYHLDKKPWKCLQEADRARKKMYLEAYLQQRRRLFPFIASIDGLLGVEAGDNLKRLSIRLATKWR